MAARNTCPCPRCMIRSLMGPAVIITVGVLFLLNEMRGGYFSFSNTYPMILIVIGAILLGASLAPMEGHVGCSTPAAPMPQAPGAAAPGVPPQSPFPGRGQ